MKSNIEILCFLHNSQYAIIQLLNNFDNHFSKSEIKITFIDNNCTDETISILQTRLKKNWRLLKETRQGLNFARSLAVLNSTADILVFCDDDNILEQNYIENVTFLFNKYPNLGAVGPGIVIPVDENLKLLDELYRSFFQYKEHDHELLLAGPSYGWQNMPAGTGLCMRRDIALSFFKKLELGTYKSTDRKGNQLSSGGDTQLVYEALKLGYVAGISGRLALKHLTIKRKLQRNYIQRMYFGVYSCAPAHVEAWPELYEQFVNEKHKNVIVIFLLHILKYKHRAFHLGKYKHFISQVARKKGKNDLLGKTDVLLDLITYLFRLR